jgi:hypothetical protein
MIQRRFATFLLLAAPALALFPSAAVGQNTGSESRAWTGTLFDYGRTTCSTEVGHASAPGTCPVTVCTAQFGIRLPDGKLYKFDDGSNPKAADALRQSKRGSKIVHDYWRTGKTSKPITARVTGTLTSDTLNLERIQVD